MKMSGDSITTYSTLATIVFGTLTAQGIAPEFFGLLTAISHGVTGFYTNKRRVK